MTSNETRWCGELAHELVGVVSPRLRCDPSGSLNGDVIVWVYEGDSYRGALTLGSGGTLRVRCHERGVDERLHLGDPRLVGRLREALA